MYCPGAVSRGGNCGVIQQVRFLSRRKYAYPQAYKAEVDPQTHPKKDHRTWFRRHLKAWLGPMNIRGEYYKNKYYYPPQDHKPRYIVQDGKTDGTVAEAENSGGFQRFQAPRSPLQPFPENPHCKTNVMLSHDLQSKLHTELTKNSLSPQQVAHKYGIKIGRVEALAKLYEIKQQWQQQVCITRWMQDSQKHRTQPPPPMAVQ